MNRHDVLRLTALSAVAGAVYRLFAAEVEAGCLRAVRVRHTEPGEERLLVAPNFVGATGREGRGGLPLWTRKVA